MSVRKPTDQTVTHFNSEVDNAVLATVIEGPFWQYKADNLEERLYFRDDLSLGNSFELGTATGQQRQSSHCLNGDHSNGRSGRKLLKGSFIDSQTLIKLSSRSDGVNSDRL